MNTAAIRKLAERVEQLEKHIEESNTLTDEHRRYWHALIACIKWKRENPKVMAWPPEVRDACGDSTGTPHPGLWRAIVRPVEPAWYYRFENLMVTVIRAALEAIEEGEGELTLDDLRSDEGLEFAIDYTTERISDPDWIAYQNKLWAGPEPKRIEESTPVEDDLIEDDSSVSSEIEPEPVEVVDTPNENPQQQNISQGGIVAAKYVGAVEGYSILTTTGHQLVLAGRTYELSANVWANLQREANKYQSWEKVS